MTLKSIGCASAALLVLSSGLALAQDAPSLRDLERSKSSFVSSLEAFGEATWPGLVAPYERSDPGISELMPGKEWDDEDRAVYACAYDKLTAAGQMEEFHQFQVISAQMSRDFASDDSITVNELVGAEGGEPLMIQYYERGGVSFDEMAGLLNDCGALELNSRRLQESGAMQRIMQIFLQEE